MAQNLPTQIPDAGFVRHGVAVRELKKLLAERDPHFEGRIDKTARSLRPLLHDSLKAETLLKLNWDDARKNIRLQTVEGIPVELEHVFNEQSDAAVWKLVLHQSQIESAVQVTNLFETDFARIGYWLGLDPDGAIKSQLQSISCLYQDALSRIDQHPLAKNLRFIDRDLLGAYSPDKIEVQIHWMPIALWASNMNVSVESLTTVVVAHEYAHAYTHAGLDLDGHSWETTGFTQTARVVTEGLAQHYTELAPEKLATRLPEVTAVFNKLLDRQSDIYKKYRTLLNSNERNKEIMRRVLVDARRTGVMNESEFSQSIQQHAKLIGGRRNIKDPLPLHDIPDHDDDGSNRQDR
jgi:hypothetical protein